LSGPGFAPMMSTWVLPDTECVTTAPAFESNASSSARAAQHETVRQILRDAWHRRAPVSHLGQRLSRSYAPEKWTASETIDLALRAGSDSLAHFLALRTPRCPSAVLRSHATSACWWLRLAVAGNPTTPRGVVESLATDHNWVVRAAAREAAAATAARPRGSAAEPGRRGSGDGAPADEGQLDVTRIAPEARRLLAVMRAKLRSSREPEVIEGVRSLMQHPDCAALLRMGLTVINAKSGPVIRIAAGCEIAKRVLRPLRQAAAREVMGVGNGGSVDGAAVAVTA
jgi:hypothetical protein